MTWRRGARRFAKAKSAQDKTSRHRKWWRCWRDKRGVAALEFALVGPILILLIMGVIETGMIFYAQFVLKNAVSNTARILRTNQDSSLNSVTALRNYICTTEGAGNILSHCSSKLYVVGASFGTSLTNFDTLFSGDAENSSVVQASSLKEGNLYSQITNYGGTTSDSSSGTSSESGDSVSYSSMTEACNIIYLRVLYSWTVVTPGLNWFLVNFGNNARVIYVTEVFRNEPDGTDECSNT